MFYQIKNKQEHYQNVSNVLNPDQDQQNVGPDLSPKLFAKFVSGHQKLPLASKELII